MDNLNIELKAISIEDEIWKLFIKTSLKDYYISNKGRFVAAHPVNFKRDEKAVNYIK